MVLFTVDSVRAIVTSQKLRLFVPSGGQSTELTILEQYMREWFDRASVMVNQTSFEIHVYRSMMSTMKDMLVPLQKTLNDRIRKILIYLKTGYLPSLELQKKYIFLIEQKSKIEARLKLYITSLKKIVEDDHTMALMNLTVLRMQPKLYR